MVKITIYFYSLQKDYMEDSIEIIIEKLLHVTKDGASKVNICIAIIHVIYLFIF